MAGDWIKMRVDLADDPAVISIAARLKLDEFSVVGRLQALWSWADSQSRDGHAAGVTASWVNRKIQCDGFAEAMAEVQWLEITDRGITFPNFGNHNGETAKARALGKNRKQKQRSEMGGHGDVSSKSSVMSRTQRDENETREEKRREEEREIPPLPPKGTRKRTDDPVAEPEGFSQFWAAWPASKRKEARGKCAQVWVRRRLEPLAEQIIRHVVAKRDCTDWAHDGGQFVEAPLVYLNQGRWEGADPVACSAGDEGVPECPVDALMAAYAEILPTLPQSRRSLFEQSTGASEMRQRWAWVMTEVAEFGEKAGGRMATTVEEGVAWFRRFFTFVSESPLLRGDCVRNGGRRWSADLAWLMALDNFDKVMSGKYHGDVQEAEHA